MSPTDQKESVPIDLGDDPFIRLRNLLILLSQSILKVFPNVIVLLFSLFLGLLAILAFFFRVIIPPKIFQKPKVVSGDPVK